VYDAETSAPARFFLTRRDDSPAALETWARSTQGPCASVCSPQAEDAAAELAGASVTRLTVVRGQWVEETDVSDYDVEGAPATPPSTPPIPAMGDAPLDACGTCLAAAALAGGADAPLPGGPLRWQLPPAGGFSGSELTAVAHMMGDLQAMHTTFVSGSSRLGMRARRLWHPPHLLHAGVVLSFV
jgi:hypothetical protein